MAILKARFADLQSFKEDQDPCSICAVAEFTKTELEKATKSELHTESVLHIKIGDLESIKQTFQIGSIGRCGFLCDSDKVC
jgi:hypothetical protein